MSGPYWDKDLQCNYPVPGAYVEFLAGVLVGDFGISTFFPDREAEIAGFQWDKAFCDPPRQAMVALVRGHYEILAPAPDLLLFGNHPLLPSGWVPSLLCPVAEHVDNRSFTVPYLVYDDPLHTDSSAATTPSKIFIRGGDIVEYLPDLKNGRLKERGVVCYILLRGTVVKTGINELSGAALEYHFRVETDTGPHRLFGGDKGDSDLLNSYTETLQQHLIPKFLVVVLPLKFFADATQNVPGAPKFTPENVSVRSAVDGLIPTGDIFRSLTLPQVISVIPDGDVFQSHFKPSEEILPRNGVDMMDSQIWPVKVMQSGLVAQHLAWISSQDSAGTGTMSVCSPSLGMERGTAVKDLSAKYHTEQPDAMLDRCSDLNRQLCRESMYEVSKAPYETEYVFGLTAFMTAVTKRGPWRTPRHEAIMAVYNREGGFGAHGIRSLSQGEYRRLLRLYGHTGADEVLAADHAPLDEEDDARRVQYITALRKPLSETERTKIIDSVSQATRDRWNNARNLNDATIRTWDKEYRDDVRIPHRPHLLEKVLADNVEFDIPAWVARGKADPQPQLMNWSRMTDEEKRLGNPDAPAFEAIEALEPFTHPPATPILGGVPERVRAVMIESGLNSPAPVKPPVSKGRQKAVITTADSGQSATEKTQAVSTKRKRGHVESEESEHPYQLYLDKDDDDDQIAIKVQSMDYPRTAGDLQVWLSYNRRVPYIRSGRKVISGRKSVGTPWTLIKALCDKAAPLEQFANLLRAKSQETNDKLLHPTTRPHLLMELLRKHDPWLFMVSLLLETRVGQSAATTLLTVALSVALSVALFLYSCAISEPRTIHFFRHLNLSHQASLIFWSNGVKVTHGTSSWDQRRRRCPARSSFPGSIQLLNLGLFFGRRSRMRSSLLTRTIMPNGS